MANQRSVTYRNIKGAAAKTARLILRIRLKITKYHPSHIYNQEDHQIIRIYFLKLTSFPLVDKKKKKIFKKKYYKQKKL